VRVALIGPVPPHLGGATPGGVATHQAALAVGLAAAGMDAPLLATNVCVPLHAAGQPLQREKAFRMYGLPRPEWLNPEYVATVGALRATRFSAHLGLMSGRGSRREVLENVLWYRWFLDEVRPDLIHVQHPLERCRYARLVQRFEGWKYPLVVTAHSLFGEHTEETIHRLMAPNLCAADRVIAVSEHVGEQAVQLGVEPRRLRVIRSGVDTERFSPRDRAAARRQLDLDVNAPVVLFVGNLEPRKQVDVLLRATTVVRQRRPDVVLLIVGSGDSAGADDQTQRLQQLTRELGLTANVRFVGRVGDRRLLDYYAAADVFALPSSSEAQGIVALEAMACGLPVVATAVGGLLGTISDGQTGWLVPSGDATAMAERLLYVLENAATREDVGAAARGAVERDFSWQRTVESTLAVYREVAECGVRQ
jgi:glycosyltransferase involved in cell wall biosynthesis